MEKKKEKLVLRMTDEAPKEEYVDLRVPASTYHTFNALYEHAKDASMFEYTTTRRNNDSITINNELFALPEIFSDKGNPRGTVRRETMDDSLFYPGTTRDYWLYLPASYDPEEPVNLILFYDAGFTLTDPVTMEPTDDPPVFRALDNLFAEKKIPPAAALFVSYGTPGPGLCIPGAFGFEDTINRSFEYDTTSDWHARFITEEVMPRALSGISVSADPEDHAVCGISSSGLAAFTTAWFRPDYFRKVYTASASFVNIRNGIIWPYAIRANEKKDLKIFSTAGKYDLDSVFGNWLSSNYAVGAALHSRQYEHRLYLTDAGHSIYLYNCLMPAALEWLFSGTEMEETEHIRRLYYEETLIP